MENTRFGTNQNLSFCRKALIKPDQPAPSFLGGFIESIKLVSQGYSSNMKFNFYVVGQMMF